METGEVGPLVGHGRLNFIPDVVGIYAEERNVTILINHTFCSISIVFKHACLYIFILINNCFSLKNKLG